MIRRSFVYVAFCLSLVACQGEDNDVGGDSETSGYVDPNNPCGECAPGGYAVDCGYLWGIGEYTVCGINQDNAEYLCTASWGGIILASPSDDCDGLSPEPWDPSVYVHPSPDANNHFLIEFALLDRLEEHPDDIYHDATRLDWTDDGSIYVSTDGELSGALGLERGDVLIDVNGYTFNDMLDTLGLYYRLRETDRLLLTLERRGTRMSLSYSIEP